MSEPLLDVAGLGVRFGAVAAVRDLSLTVAAGEAVGIVGESGCGKSAALLALMGLHPRRRAVVTARHLRLGGTDILGLSDRRLRDLRGRRAAMIFQDPLTALNPLLTIGTQITEVLARHRGLRPAAARAEAASLLARVEIRDASARLAQYPHQFSGGMRQRVMIAMALAGDPQLLLADEPTTALDVTVQAELVRLIRRLRAERDMGLVWVTHDLALMAGIVDRVVVMYAGQVVETAPAQALYARPRHPYTQALLHSLPRLDQPLGARARPLTGQPPDPASPAPGCPFAPRCPRRFARCDAAPPLLPNGDSRAACWLLDAGASIGGAA